MALPRAGRGRGRGKVMQSNGIPEHHKSILEQIAEDFCNNHDTPTISSSESNGESAVSSNQLASLKNGSSQETEALSGLNLSIPHDTEIETLYDLPLKKMHTFRVRRVESPHEFFMEYAAPCEDRNFNQLVELMQAFYRKPKNRKLMQLETLPSSGRCYACLDFKTSQWHRVRVHHVRAMKSMAIVYYLDLCKVQEVELKNLCELAAHFVQIPAQVLRCYLTDVRPCVKAADQDAVQWSNEALVYFDSLVHGKEFSGIVLTRSNVLVCSDMPDYITTIGVVLVENRDGTRIPKIDICTVNAQLVDAGFAEPTGIFAACEHDMKILSCSYTPDLNWNKQLKLSSDKATGKTNKKAPNWVPKTITPETVAAYYRLKNRILPWEIVSCLAAVELIHASDPCFLIVRPLCKMYELDAMHHELKGAVKDASSVMNGEPGMYVACEVADESNNSVWQRGIIKSVATNANSEEMQYTIILVDSGTEVVMDCASVRQLPAQFQEIPSYAIRIHLDGELTRSNACTPEMLTKALAQYKVDSNGTNRVCFLFKPACSQVLVLSHFLQKVVYNAKKNKMCKEIANSEEEELYEVINDRSNDITLYSLFRSTGMELLFEDIMPDSDYWHFKSVIESAFSKQDQVGKFRSQVRIHKYVTEHAASSGIERSPLLLLRQTP